MFTKYSKSCVITATLKNTKSWFSRPIIPDCKSKVLQNEHFAVLLTFIKLPLVINIFVVSISEWLFYTGFTVGLL